MSRPSGPRIRSIKPETWQDERLAGLGDFEPRLYLGLVSQADDEGRQSANPSLIRSRIFPFDQRTPDELAAGLATLQDAGLIRLSHADGRDYLTIVSWADDQRIDKPTPSRLPAPSSEIP